MGNILIVDDDALSRQIAGDILVQNGHNVLKAEGPAKGIALLKTENIEVVLLDVIMPGTSGFEMLPQIKQVNSDIEVIIMTAFASTDSAVEAIRSGAFNYIRKPLQPEELVHFVKKALERHHLVHENRSLVKNLKERVRRLELFESISKTISSTLDMQRLLEKVMHIGKSVLQAEACSILLLDEKTNDLVFTVALGEKGEEVKEYRVKPGQGIAGWVLENGEPLLVSDVTKDSRFDGGVDEKSGFHTKSMIAVPLFVKEKNVGVIEVINREDGTPFDEADMETLITMSGQVAVSLDNAKMTADLVKSNEQIEEYSKNLEMMVRKRTAQLENTNRELKSMQAHLLQSEKLSSLGQLAAGVAHEINNPIGFINSNLRTLGEYAEGFIDLVNRYEEIITHAKEKDDVSFNKKLTDLEKAKRLIKFDFLKNDIGKLIEESREGTYRVYKIVRDLRNFSRADDAERELFDIHRSIDSTLNIVWNEIKYKAEVEKEYGNIPEIECFPAQLNQIFMNILVNAAQSIEKRGKIKIKTYVDGENVVIEISDTGSGMPQENISKIFDPFFTTKEPGRGTGLGLSIVYNIVKKHKGNIRVKSIPGKGTKFIISLPIEMKLAEGEERAAFVD